MSSGLILVTFFAILLIVMFSGAPVFAALGTAGIVGILAFLGSRHIGQIGITAYTYGTSYNQIILPMFVMMSELLSKGQIAEDIYSVLNRGVGKFKGGLAIATTLACTIFAALCGSSPATAASIGRISIQEMMKRGYSPDFAVGTVAASGTLGIMIPPSITFCFYGILTETSIIKLLMAGIVPGIILSAMIIIFIIIRVRLNPRHLNWTPETADGPKNASEIDMATAREIVDEAKRLSAEEAESKETVATVKPQIRKEPTFFTILPALILIIVVLGSMYAGFATPMEAAGYGVIGALIITVFQRRITAKIFVDVLSGSARTGAMMIFMIICGFILTYCISFLGIAQGISDAISKSGLNKYVVLVLLYLLWIVLGALIDPGSVIILTIPFLFKPLVDSGFDPVWIGVVTVLGSQIGMISPPVGLNLFVLKANTNVEMKYIMRGAIPYVVLFVIALALFTIFPGIALFLPNLMF